LKGAAWQGELNRNEPEFMLYQLTKRLFRTCVPRAAQERLWKSNGLLNRMALTVKQRLERSARHNDIYDEGYYQKIDVDSSISAEVITESIKRDLDPQSVVDVGCGSGAFLLAFKRRGVGGVGLEHSEAAISMCTSRGLEVTPFDLESTDAVQAKGDVVVCFEVAEHLPMQFADRLVSTLTEAGRTVVFTAATPGQGGTDHVNEQPHEYWIEKFAARGFHLDVSTGERWRSNWQRRGVTGCYWRNVMVFRAVSASAAI
jgi:2-polyprenyl-3-methyl-5-hydroxy-6-metoxy-1,4-benzoquinol methylase